ncbi:MAG TPA: OmpA family protein, partial [Polyangiaceae bacterium]
PALSLVACASTPPPELNSAHNEYNRVSQSEAASLDPTDVHLAQEALAQADKSFDDHGDNQHTRDLAYAAQRKAELADVRAQAIGANNQQMSAKKQLDDLKTSKLNQTEGALSQTQQQLALQGQALATAQQQKADAERRAKEAQDTLAQFAKVKQEDRGMVITLNGSVLFASAKYDLLPAATNKLQNVADVLSKQDKESKITVQGFTDSTGSQSFNETLSQHRAESVRTYLVSHGIASDRVTAQGMGPANPVADNATAEGRADNRRVEIVVSPPQGSTGNTSPSSMH